MATLSLKIARCPHNRQKEGASKKNERTGEPEALAADRWLPVRSD